tara:strand:- start:8649 stop:11003 length:2355 start_codon:yes stop_codon:yes gene_type:complete
METERIQKLKQLNAARRARGDQPTNNQQSAGPDPMLVLNAMTQRSDLLSTMFDPRRDINTECGYPNVISDEQYRAMYDRELGRRVVNVYPEETWRMLPIVSEDPDPEVVTPFEVSWDELEAKHNLLHYLQRADELSGVGHYGIILIGLNDGLPLHMPVAGFNEDGTVTSPRQGTEIIYLRVLDESLVDIASWQGDPTVARYGQPTAYNITLSDPRNQEASAVATPPDTTESKVHWSRILHVADNRKTSEVLGTPRMEPVWNRLYDLRKVLGGSGEMYWRGGFPGVALETQPGLENAELDEEATRSMMYDYMNGLQRYIALTGMTAKSLAPQISDPTSTFEAQIKAICIIIGVPYRVFMGTEEARLAGEQDTNAWNGRLQNRQARYVTPMLINPFVRRLIEYGVLVPPAEENGWNVDWPDAHTPSELQRAEVASKRTEALAKYIGGGVDTLIPPFEYLTHITGLDKDVVEAILDAAIEHIEEVDDDEAITPGRLPTPEELQDVAPEGEGEGEGGEPVGDKPPAGKEGDKPPAGKEGDKPDTTTTPGPTANHGSPGDKNYGSKHGKSSKGGGGGGGGVDNTDSSEPKGFDDDFIDEKAVFGHSSDVDALFDGDIADAGAELDAGGGFRTGVEVSELIPTQEYTHSAKAKGIAADFDSSKVSVSVIEKGGKTYIYDGHHTAAAAVYAGKTKLKVRMVEAGPTANHGSPGDKNYGSKHGKSSKGGGGVKGKDVVAGAVFDNGEDTIKIQSSSSKGVYAVAENYDLSRPTPAAMAKHLNKNNFKFIGHE